MIRSTAFGLKMTEKITKTWSLKVVGNCKSSESIRHPDRKRRSSSDIGIQEQIDQVVLSRQIEHNNGSKTNNDTYYLYDEFDNFKKRCFHLWYPPNL